MVADRTPSFFISYSSEDRRYAEELTARLRGAGAEVWVDYERMGPGDPILHSISEGLGKADVLLLLLSKNSGQSPWCRREYEALLQTEIQSGETRVVVIRIDDTPLPLLLKGKRYVLFDDTESDMEALLVPWDGKSRRHTDLVKTNTISLPDGLLRGLTFLLLMDQFPVGVWGRSLSQAAMAYGHGEDPGSITISGWSADALRDLQPVGSIPEIERFTSYLKARRLKDTGAVGMLKQLGSAFAEQKEIVVNRRHTATAALFLYRHCNELDAALQSLRFVMEARTSRGAWVAVGDTKDEKADPVTTAFVLSVLRTFEKDGLLAAVGLEDRDLFLSRYWKTGLLWLYENLLENNGWWSYMDNDRVYAYTTDILLVLPEFWIYDPDFAKAHEKLLLQLFDVWKTNGTGIPRGPRSPIPELETTAQLAWTLAKCETRYPDVCHAAQELFFENVETILATGESNAAGWASTIRYLAEVYGTDEMPSVDLPSIREKVDRAKKGDEVDVANAVKDANLPRWVSRIARDKILSVTIVPP